MYFLAGPKISSQAVPAFYLGHWPDVRLLQSDVMLRPNRPHLSQTALNHRRNAPAILRARSAARCVAASSLLIASAKFMQRQPPAPAQFATMSAEAACGRRWSTSVYALYVNCTTRTCGAVVNCVGLRRNPKANYSFGQHSSNCQRALSAVCSAAVRCVYFTVHADRCANHRHVSATPSLMKYRI